MPRDSDNVFGFSQLTKVHESLVHATASGENPGGFTDFVWYNFPDPFQDTVLHPLAEM